MYIQTLLNTTASKQYHLTGRPCFFGWLHRYNHWLH